MKPIKFSVSDTSEEIAVGKSKFLGEPDVWEDFEWPTSVDDGEEFDLNFMMQINCEEIAKYDVENKLPHEGILYFFFDYEGMPTSSEHDPKGARVLYFNGNKRELDTIVLLDENDNEIHLFPTCKMHFGVEEPDEFFQLLGEPALMEYGFEAPKGHVLLAQIDEFSGKNFDLTFVDCGVLQFYITPEDLAQRDFSKVKYLVIYS